MIKMASTKGQKKNQKRLWTDVTEQDFIDESENIIDEDAGEYDKKAMTFFIQNSNLMRHLPRLADSLKPVERRSLMIMYELGALPGRKNKKSAVITGETMTLHPHGDSSIYGTLVGMAQHFTNPVPLVDGTGNFGNSTHPKGYAHMRYTEMLMSRYAYDCFFKDYDPDCIETIFNTSKDEDEPLSLPSKYPNILVNGGFGIATGNMFCIPPYHIPDIVKLIKKLLRNPDTEDIYLLPDIPTGCDIVDSGSLREICDTGNGVLRMRSTITVEENPKKPNIWILRVRNLPWMVELDSINKALSLLTKQGKLPIKDIEDHSYAVEEKDPNGKMITSKRLQYDIIINRAHDPNKIIQKLFKLTQLEKTISVNFKVVEDALSIGILNMRDLGLTWIATRREYKRRLINKKITKLKAKISFLEILIVITNGDNLQKTIHTIRTHNESDLVKALMNNKEVKINSYQAEKIVDMKFRMISKDAHDKYVKEKEKLEEELEKYLKMTRSSKIIDEEIEVEIEDLLKYSTGDRKSRIISGEDSVEIADTNHFISISKLGMIKKLPYDETVMMRKKTPSLGVFKNQDYPLHGIVINNHDSLMMFDNFGRFSCIPVHEIDSTEPSQYGSSVYDTTKLNGEIVEAFQYFSKDIERFIDEKIGADAFVVSLTKNGYLKKTTIREFTTKRNQKNIRAIKLREDDELVTGKIILEKHSYRPTNLLVYTEKGTFSYIESDHIAEQSKDASGLLSVNLLPDDACKGMCVIGKDDTHLLIVTEKGNMKRCELGYLGQPGKRKVSSYLATLDPEDKICYVDAIQENSTITVCTRTSYQEFKADDIPVKARKTKCVKMIPVPLGNNIISVGIK